MIKSNPQFFLSFVLNVWGDCIGIHRVSNWYAQRNIKHQQAYKSNLIVKSH